ncbi:hypothetical protein EV193_109250 [Herbihabitans rhizosphaerae]|uniref:Alpha/beta hydrolase family protein n=1 Tax=Herbihabitans rhizosphaerae TaxID=1872711 RepID=A0A4Q7KH43_9PSEU|nr:alpha/beta hydrolase [Herbihabitans rhizosphaerae]RZS34459.1 hypothetical protein EV193_109250 [Herbihabitans rhizosphaerae]
MTTGTGTPVPRTAVVLPGTGSDEVFVRAAFEVPLAAIGVRLVAPEPVAGPRLAEEFLAALEAAEPPVLVGGVSLGAHLAAQWAVANPNRCLGLLAALPAWNGPPNGAPAATAAQLSADAVRDQGLDGALAIAVDGVAPWLADELTRAWHRYGDALAESLDVAATHTAPTLAELATLDMPTGIATCADDPVHPAAVAHTWAKALPRAAVSTTRLDIVGHDREALGRATVLAWLRAGGRV